MASLWVLAPFWVMGHLPEALGIAKAKTAGIASNRTFSSQRASRRFCHPSFSELCNKIPRIDAILEHHSERRYEA
jgi:hypothetical protein